jgi:hypothetical protein
MGPSSRACSSRASCRWPAVAIVVRSVLRRTACRGHQPHYDHHGGTGGGTAAADSSVVAHVRNRGPARRLRAAPQRHRDHLRLEVHRQRPRRPPSPASGLPRPHRRPRTKVDHGGRPTPTNFRRRPHRLPTARRSAKDVRKWLSRWIDCPDALSPASVRSSARCSRRPGWPRTSSPKSWMSGGRGLNNHRGGRKRARRRAAPPARPGLAHPPRPRRSMTLPLDDLAAQRPDVVRLMALGLAG